MTTPTLTRMRRALVGAAVLVCAGVLTPTIAAGTMAHSGHPTLSMLTGSMQPWAAPGDLLIDRAVPARDIRVGDVITFHAPEAGSPVVSHRVVDRRVTGGVVRIRTRGDANSVTDPWMLRYPLMTASYRATSVIPHGGTVLAEARSRAARTLLALAVFVLVLALVSPRGRAAITAPAVGVAT